MKVHRIFRLVATLAFGLSILAGPMGQPTPAASQSPSYVFRRSWGGEGGQLIRPNSVAVVVDDTNYTIYVANTEMHRIDVIRPGEQTVEVWGGFGSGNGQFEFPRGIAVDGNGNVYVADSMNNRIQKFSAAGVYLDQWGSQGNSNGQFVYPHNITVDASGNVYVVDSWNYRIQEFSPGLPAPDPSSGLALNGSFEASPALAEWTTGGTLTVTLSTHAWHGSSSLLLGTTVPQTPRGEGQAWATTNLYVPPGWTRPELSFHYNIFANDTMGNSDFFVAVQDGLGLSHQATVVRDGYPGNAAPGTPGTDLGWRSVLYDLSAFKGQHIRIVFANRNQAPNSLGAWTYLDDVRVLNVGLSWQRLYLPGVLTHH